MLWGQKRQSLSMSVCRLYSGCARTSASPMRASRALLLALCVQLFPIRSLCATWTAVVTSSCSSHSCGLRAAAGGGSDLYCWGYNDNGQLGLGYVSDTGCTCVASIPSAPVLTNVSAVCLGHDHTCALYATGIVVCWGGNYAGQLGLGYSGNPVLSAALVPSLTGIQVVIIAAGYAYTCAVKSEGTLYCWGQNTYGQLGNSVTGPIYSSPVQVLGISGVIAVSCGQYHTCVLTSSGGIYCWGWNGYGQLGNDGTNDLHVPPAPAAAVLTGIAAISAGAYHTCALSSAGGVYCWGQHIYGQLGLGYATPSGCGCVPSPPLTSSPILTGVAQISAGEAHTCALTTGVAGNMFCWGNNYYGQLGNGYANSGASVLSPPVTLPPVLSGVAAIMSAWVHTCALITEGDIECWGDNQNGEAGSGVVTTQANSPPTTTPSQTRSTSPSLTPPVSSTPMVSTTRRSETMTMSTTTSITVTVTMSTTTSSATATAPLSATGAMTITATPSATTTISATESTTPTPTMEQVPGTRSATPTTPAITGAADVAGTGTIAGALVGGVGGILLLSLCMICCKKWHARRCGEAATRTGPQDEIPGTPSR